jgi:hypothetical protein
VPSQQLLTKSQVFENEVLPELKALSIQPRKCRSDPIIAEKSDQTLRKSLIL